MRYDDPWLYIDDPWLAASDASGDQYPIATSVVSVLGDVAGHAVLAPNRRRFDSLVGQRTGNEQ